MRLALLPLLLSGVVFAAPLRVASLNLTGVDVEKEKLEFLSDHFAQGLSSAGAKVTSSRDIAALLGMERQKELLGCQEGSCIAELSAALGVDAMASGDIARLAPGRYQVNLKIIRASDGQRLDSRSFRVDGEEALLDGFDGAAAQLVQAAASALDRTLSPSAKPTVVRSQVADSGGAVRKYAVVPLSLGVVGVGVGTFFLVQSENSWSKLSTAADPQTAQAAASDGEGQQTASRIGFAAGGALIASAVVMYLVGAPVESTPVSLATDGRSVALWGRF
jgi:hypothetical protein